MVQKTLGARTQCSGIGVHSGLPATLTLLPAPADHGIRFKRIEDGDNTSEIPALADRVTDVRLATRLSNETHCVETVEHLLAALYALGVDNALIEIDGPEIPIMDGSAAVFCRLIRSVGLVDQVAPRKVLRLLESVLVSDGAKWARLSPRLGNTLELHTEIDFPCATIGVQAASFCEDTDDFESSIASARTFGFAWEVDALRQSGLARGGSLDNAIVVDRDGIVNPEGLRFNNEFARHKLLDAIGDLSLAGVRIAGRYEAYQPGHKLNYQLVCALLDSPSSWYVDSAPAGDMLQGGARRGADQRIAF
ncbi:MAG: UDP-3-O-acyl-N-acetylglucosamine deacetylase [Pseudomonadota bacterium]